ncbi:MAG: hypothetical protein J7L77_05355, partial [Clostridiales bacterium]|nr:hypothetical protein [Clostridiales bacterium]
SKILTGVTTHTEHTSPSVVDSKAASRCFEIKKITSLTRKCIPYALPTANSPYWQFTAVPFNLKVSAGSN